jgi:hypothetical protein
MDAVKTIVCVLLGIDDVNLLLSMKK